MECEFDQYNKNHPCYSSYHLDFVIARLLNFLSSAGWIMRIGSDDLSRFPNLTSIGNNSMAFRDHVLQCGFSINCYVMTTCLKRSIHHPNTPVFFKHRHSKFIINTRLFKLVWVVRFLVFGLCWMLRFMNTKVHAIHSKQKDWNVFMDEIWTSCCPALWPNNLYKNGSVIRPARTSSNALFVVSQLFPFHVLVLGFCGRKTSAIS